MRAISLLWQTGHRDAEKVFERYFTKDPVRTGSNSGLGLTISKTLTERMGGRISAALEDQIFRIEVLFKKAEI